jgi:dTDP-4-dehydrorhamnose reductase/UDP-glucose 4-epimerase
MGDTTLIVGRNSLLARAFRDHGGVANCRFVGHDELDRPDLLDGVGRIVNFAYHPELRSGPYRAELDIDLRLGRAAAELGLGYVMLSTRKVYAPEYAFGASEDAPVGPVDAYGRNKLTIERLLANLLGERLTVLRVGNVVGYDRIDGRPSFMSVMLGRLANEGRVTLDVSPFTRRDFLPIEQVAAAIKAVLNHRLGGTYNVGSGACVEIGRMALWVIEGFGKGELVVTSPRIHDEFALDIGKLMSATDWYWPSGALPEYCRSLGRRLAKMES